VSWNKNYIAFQTNSKQRPKGTLIIVKTELNPIIPFAELNTVTTLVVKVFSKIGHLFISAIYISPEDKEYY